MSEDKNKGAKKVNLGLLKIETEEEIKYVQNKINIEDKEVYILSNQFFKKLLELDYEPTYEELIDEIDKIYLDKQLRNEIKAFIIDIGQIEYSRKKFTQEELRILLDELRTLARRLIHVHQEKGILNRILIKLGAKEEQPAVLASDIRNAVKKEEEEMEEKVLISELRDHLIKSEKSIDQEHNEEKAKENYKQAMEIYGKLKKENQELIYPEIMRTYNHLT